MPKKTWKSYVIPSIFITVFLLAVVFTAMQKHPVNEYPDQLALLSDRDFVIAATDPALEVGEADLGDVALQFPGGHMLGRSGVYRPADCDALFTFTRKTNLLNKVDINGPGLATSRSISVNDSFDKVVAAYGDGFIRSYFKNEPQKFDAVYGKDHCIVFNIDNNQVKRIVMLHDIDIKTGR